MEFAILENIGLDNSYSDTLDFPADSVAQSKLNQKAFWDSKVIRVFEEIRWIGTNRINLDMDYNETLNYSYCYYEIKINNVLKRFYAFITDIRMIGNQTIELTLDIDVFQTYFGEYQILDSYIDRQHEDRFNSSQKRIFNTIPEDIYYGENYKENVMERLETNHSAEVGVANKLFFAVITSTDNIGNLTKIPYSPSALSTYIIPFLYSFNVDGSGNYSLERIKNYKTGTYFPRLTDVINLSQSDTIKSINIVPYFDNGLFFINEGEYCFSSVESTFGTLTLDGHSYSIIVPSTSSNLTPLNFIINKIDASIPTMSKDNNRNMIFESKLYTDPYFFYELFRFNNEPYKIKNEYLPDSNYFDLDYYLTADGIIRETSFIRRYKLTNQSMKSLDHKFEVVNNEELPLKSDQWLNYLQNNKSTIQNGALLKGGTAVASLIGGALTGSFGIGTGVQTAIGTTSSILSDQMHYSDIKQAPDTIRNVGNCGSYMFNSGLGHYFISYKQITDEYRNKVYDLFYRFGYRSKSFGVPNLQSRYYFNFIKTININLTGSLNNRLIDTLKASFNRGVRIWHYRNELDFNFKNYEKENMEMSLMEA